MSTTISPTILEIPELAPTVQHSGEILERILGPSAGQIAATWHLGRDNRHRQVIELELTDHTSSVHGQFFPEELNQVDRFEGRLLRLWGDLLQERSHKQLARLKEMVQQLED